MFSFQNFAIIPKEIETILMQTFEGKTKSSTVFLKKAYWIKDLLLVFWQKRKLTEKIISNNEGYINGDGLSKSVFWVTQIGQKWGIQTIYSKIWAKKLPSNEKSPLTVDVRVIVNKTSLLKLSNVLATPATNKKTKRKQPAPEEK